MSKVIYEGKSLAVVKCCDDYLIIPKDKVGNEDYIEFCWSNESAKLVPTDRAIEFWAQIFLEK